MFFLTWINAELIYFAGYFYRFITARVYHSFYATTSTGNRDEALGQFDISFTYMMTAAPRSKYERRVHSNGRVYRNCCMGENCILLGSTYIKI